MQLNIKLQNVIIVAGFLLTVILCLEYDIRANAITTPSQASQFIFPRAMDAWDVAFACMAGVAAVLFFYIGFRYKAIRREKGTSLLSSLVFSSATYQGSSYVLFVLRTLFTSGEDMNAIVQVGFKMYLPLGILAMLFFCFVVIEVFLKPAISQEKQHRIEIAIQALQAFGIIIGIIITLFVYTVNGSTFEIAFGAIGFSVFGLIVLVVIYVIVQIIKVGRQVNDPVQRQALLAIVIQVALLLLVTLFMVQVEMASFTLLAYEARTALLMLQGTFSVVIALLYHPAFIKPSTPHHTPSQDPVDAN